MKMLFFYRDMMRKASNQHIHHKNKQAMAMFLFFLLIKLPWSTFHVKTVANSQSRAGRDFLVACNLQLQEIISKAHFPQRAAFCNMNLLDKDRWYKFKHVDGSNKSGMPNSIQMLSSEDSSIEQY